MCVEFIADCNIGIKPVLLANHAKCYSTITKPVRPRSWTSKFSFQLRKSDLFRYFYRLRV